MALHSECNRRSLWTRNNSLWVATITVGTLSSELVLDSTKDGHGPAFEIASSYKKRQHQPKFSDCGGECVEEMLEVELESEELEVAELELEE